jgi:hypothetical protein
MGSTDQPNEGESRAIALLRDGFSRAQESLEELLEAAEPRMLRFRASENSNSMAWLIWHLSRVQDDHFTHLALSLGQEQSLEQCWVSKSWATTFNLSYPLMETGYGQGIDAVADFGMYDGEYLLGYHQDVHQLTMSVLDRLTEQDLDTVIDRRWNPEVTALTRLVSILGEVTAHLAQAQFLQGIHKDALSQNGR